jgi:hypothetical protein
VDRWAYSEYPTGGTIYTLGALNHYRPNERYDVAVVEILDPDTKERLRTNWRFLTLKQVSLPHEGAEFFVSGYPSALAISEQTAVRGVLLTLETQRIPIPSDATKPVDPDADYFFDAGPNVFSGKYADLEIHGMSGSAVGELRTNTGSGLWMPDHAIHVVAVQTAVRKQRYIRAASWSTVAALLEGVEPGLAGALRQRLASTKQ